ncbi:MAG: hypothetical protein HY275_16325 [Gemmatimonadetes bacterium]|nr:hypothetical protein [Gemmatimonadota bacterium]
MVGFFPRESIRWSQIEEPPLMRRLSIVPWPLAVVAGVGVRLAHAGLFGIGTRSSLLAASVYAVVLVLLACGSLTAHVGNFPVRSWGWRVPFFAVIESVTEGLTSLVLIGLGVEPIGADRATVDEWPAIALTIVRNRLILLAAFGVVLATVVEGARLAFFQPVERARMDDEASSEAAAIATGEHVPPDSTPD